MSRGYLRYIEQFLRELGVSVERISPDSEIVSEFWEERREALESPGP